MSDRTQRKSITFADTRYGSVSVTPRQQALLTQAGIWLRNAYGEEYATVSHGLHFQRPSLSDATIQEIIDGKRSNVHPFRLLAREGIK